MDYISTWLTSNLPWFCLHALQTSSLLVVAFERLKHSFNIYSVILLACLTIARQNEIRALPHSATSSLHNHYSLPGVFCTSPPCPLRLLYSLLVVIFLGRGCKLPTSTRSNLGWPFIMFKKLNQCSTRGFYRAILILELISHSCYGSNWLALRSNRPRWIKVVHTSAASAVPVLLELLACMAPVMSERASDLEDRTASYSVPPSMFLTYICFSQSLLPSHGRWEV